MDRLRQVLLAILGALGSLHFVLGFMYMIPFIWSMRGYRLTTTVFSLPYAGLLVLFIAAFGTAVAGRLRASTWLLGLGILCSAALCAYDLSHGSRAQILGGGVGGTYLFWWWYYEPDWYNYRPGNV